MARSVATAVANARPNRAYNGGTTAPPGTARSPTTGLSGNKAFDPSHPSYVPKPQPKPKPKPMTAAEENARRKPPAPAVNPALPWDSTAQSQVNDATTTRNNTIADLQTGWTGRETYYGFGENGANNPYSQAALLATHHEWNERGRSNASGLQAFSGSNVNAEREEVGRYSTSYEQLLQAFEAEKAAKTRSEEDAENELQNVAGEGGTAQLGAIGRASEADPEPVAPPAKGNQKPPKPNDAPKGKKWAWNGSQWHLVKA